MLDRLKSLPLTIILTILIWMYAEAQFTSTQDNVRLSVKLLAPSSDQVVLGYDPIDDRYRDTINIVATIQGAKSQIDQIYQMSLNASPQNHEFKQLTFAAPLTDPSIDTVTMLNGLSYFRSKGVTVTAANPPRVRIKVEKRNLPDTTPPATTSDAH